MDDNCWYFSSLFHILDIAQQCGTFAGLEIEIN